MPGRTAQAAGCSERDGCRSGAAIRGQPSALCVLRYSRQIVDLHAHNAVSLCGAIHCASVTQLEFGSNDEVSALRVCSITSPTLYWLSPFADGGPAGFVHASNADGRKDTFELDNGATVQYWDWGLSQEDNSCPARRAPSANMLTRARHLVEGQGIFLSFVD